MSKELNAELLMVAAKALRLGAIVLYDAHFSRGKEPEGEPQLKLQHKRAVRFVHNRTQPDAEFADHLQVGVRLGYRVVQDTDGDAPMVFEIEAEFVVDYGCDKALADEAVKAFAELNCVHIVWPFWRQHVFDIVARANLPPFEVPLLSGTRL